MTTLGPRVRAPKRGPEWRSGFCNPSNDKKSHGRCEGAYVGKPCVCACHQTTAPAPRPSVFHGFVDDLDEEEYHRHPTSLSVSGAKVLLKAPALFDWQRHNPVFKQVWDFGTAAHTKVLGIGSPIVVHQYDATKVKSPKSTNAWKDQQAEVRASGGVLLLPDENAQVDAMAAKLTEHRLAMRLLSNGRPEVSAFCEDERTGVMRRGRVDWLSPNIITDYKSAVSADPREFQRAAFNFGYFMQAPWYVDLLRDLGLDIGGFAFIVQMKEPPYLVSVIELDDDAMRLGRERNHLALEVFRDCTESGIWPAYLPDTEFATVSLPGWVHRQEAMY